MNEIATQAYVLHTYRYRETSLIVELLTRTQGRVSVIAKGVRRPKSPWRGLLQPFVPLDVTYRGRHALKLLTRAEPNGAPIFFKEKRLYMGFYLNECLVRLLHRDEEHEDLFVLYQKTLRSLVDGEIEPALRLFEKRLLESLGYAIAWTHTTTHDGIVGEHYYRYYPEQGFMLDQAGDHAYLGRDLLAIAQEDFSDKAVLKSAKHIFRMALQPLFGDKPLATRSLLLG
ncbi:MAG: DNA repair protein RecO [Gammaproteobacteria bacterium]